MRTFERGVRTYVIDKLLFDINIYKNVYIRGDLYKWASSFSLFLRKAHSIKKLKKKRRLV